MAEAKIKVDRFCMLQQKKNHLRRDGGQNDSVLSKNNSKIIKTLLSNNNLNQYNDIIINFHLSNWISFDFI